MKIKYFPLALATALCTVAFAPSALAADDDVALIRALEQRLLAAEDKLQDSEATIRAQRDLLRNSAMPAVSQGSGLDAFFSKLEVGGHLTASYVYAGENPRQNTKGTGSPAPVGSQPLCMFNCNHNTFTLDAVKLEIGKSLDGPGTAGFQLDFLFGQNAAILDAYTAGLSGYTTARGGSDTDFFIQEAYVAYDLNGTELTFGKFETLLGFEVLDSPANPNISHGILFTKAIPLFHTGLLASGEINENLGWAAGVTNGFDNAIDLNDNKGLLAQIRYGAGPLATSVQAYYGADNASVSTGAVVNGTTRHGSKDDALIIDLVSTYTASDDLNFWLNIDWGEQEDLSEIGGGFETAQWWGVAVGSAIDLSDKLSLALRGEYFVDENGYRLGFGPTTGAKTDMNAYSLTGTLGYALTSNLSARMEVRYDRLDASGSIDEVFPTGNTLGASPNMEEDGVTGYFEVSYSFD
ncbi:MAG: carbohydrate porin [bacterium]|nr:carbohydrate porin [bacterium]